MAIKQLNQISILNLIKLATFFVEKNCQVKVLQSCLLFLNIIFSQKQVLTNQIIQTIKRTLRLIAKNYRHY